MYLYFPIKRRHSSPEIGEFLSFGIRAVCLSGGRFCCAGNIWDISTDKRFVAALAACCTKAQLDIIHLFDVVFDSMQ